MNNNQKQQGDVLLLKIGTIPQMAKELKRGEYVVLAEGETTGHFHGIKEEGVVLLESPDGKRYVHNSTKKTVLLIHQEHKPIKVNPGIWEIGIVREYDYFQEMERKVVD